MDVLVFPGSQVINYNYAYLSPTFITTVTKKKKKSVHKPFWFIMVPLYTMVQFNPLQSIKGSFILDCVAIYYLHRNPYYASDNLFFFSGYPK